MSDLDRHGKEVNSVSEDLRFRLMAISRCKSNPQAPQNGSRETD